MNKKKKKIKVLTATGWGKQKDTLMATYKAVMKPALEYASSIWSLLASSTNSKWLRPDTGLKITVFGKIITVCYIYI